MNATRKKALRQVLETMRSLVEPLEMALDDERSDFDELSEKAQEGERGMAMQDAAENIEGALDSVHDAISALEALTEA